MLPIPHFLFSFFGDILFSLIIISFVGTIIAAFNVFFVICSYLCLDYTHKKRSPLARAPSEEKPSIKGMTIPHINK